MNGYKGMIDNFLINPAWRIWRHALLIITLAVISFNQTFMTFGKTGELAFHTLLAADSISLILYLLLVYCNIYLLVPALLVKHKYGYYTVTLSLSVLIFLIAQTCKEFYLYDYFQMPHGRTTYFNAVSLLDGISNFTLHMVCVVGISLAVLMKHWMTDKNRISELEKRQVWQDIEQLKEQVDPDMLFKTLNRTGKLTKTEPDKAVDMLHKLSQLLRYQLYDCRREKVLLSSVIAFLHDYLSLEKQYAGKLDYVLLTEGNVTGIFVPPMIYIPFVKKAVTSMYQSGCYTSLEVVFKVADESVDFICRCGEYILWEESYLSPIRQRLDLVYKNSYMLTTHNDKKTKRNILKLRIAYDNIPTSNG